MAHTFSSELRSNYIQSLQSSELDVLIIGGGITGAGIALDAQTRGLKTGLVEMQDFAAGASSRSTKLIHGGLRYLKQFEVKLVAEVGKERAIVHENAPHVITPQWMLLPIYKNGTFGKLSTSVGLRMYDNLADVRKEERRYMLNKKKTLEKEPLLRQDKLKGGGLYVEYRTDDARLTLEILKEAVRHGAKAVSYMKVESFLYKDGRTVGVIVVDQLSGEAYKLYAKKIVNAAGPWVDTLREQDRSKQGKQIKLSKGVHLVFDHARFPLQQAVYFDVGKDGRMMFAIPREGKTYVGTTDTFFEGDIAHPRMTVADQEYILSSVNDMFPSLHLTSEDIESSWAGLRPLIYEQGKKESEISRKDEVFISESGLISIAGGKLTGYRKMAERVVDIMAKDFGNKKGCETDSITLSGGHVGGAEGFEAFQHQKIGEGLALGLEEKRAKELVQRYGSNVSKIFARMKTSKRQSEAFHLPTSLFAELRYGIEEEMVVTPLDFFHRRTGAILFNISWVERWQEPITRYLRDLFEWSEEATAKHEEELNKELYFAKKAIVDSNLS
ncbi:glycerol-3-phosphate dehydrogenase/oxidase [Halalkalibacter urbisdiaboli]|uniref:glycerol-3-phosphate dehydrogenase/oxidase n=1 Tax=Halalkalibacter urbisdiaboli TaxID=1960589 RepID=UPI000B44B199|nr:glycerol-3-phosphate dehydrogenase/oxidase [Halalkalibacter urbisdiaboli]